MKLNTIKKYIWVLAISSFFIVGCNQHQTQFISPNNEKIEYMGRIGKTDSLAVIYWSGSSMTVSFEGTSVSAVLQDEKGANYFNVIIDNDSLRILKLDALKKTYSLADSLHDGKHTVQLFKRTEWTSGKTNFYGFQVNGEVLNIPPKEKCIEFYGNSITSGYAVEDYSGNDSPDSTFTNNYNSYAAMTVRHFYANYTCISRSGIGITVSWFPQIMPDLYNRLDPENQQSKWDFNRQTPDIVVVNLFQNDSWLINRPENEEFKNRFGEKPPDKEIIINAYKGFVKNIRNKYIDAQIICMLGNMDITKEGSPWPGYVQTAVDSLKDKNIHTLFVPYKNTPGHPRIEEQRVLADSLIKFIEKKTDW
ncbi:MAG: electron transporter RnfD [Bacteroidota bacterium]